jgi:hypothetical protein
MTECGKLELYLTSSMIHMLNDNLTEQSAADEITVLFKGRVIFIQDIPKKHKLSGIELYKLCDSKGYIHNMTV